MIINPTCHKCNEFIEEGELFTYHKFVGMRKYPEATFHRDCYNRYEHYYGLDKPID